MILLIINLQHISLLNSAGTVKKKMLKLFYSLNLGVKVSGFTVITYNQIPYSSHLVLVNKPTLQTKLNKTEVKTTIFTAQLVSEDELRVCMRTQDQIKKDYFDL